MPNEANEKNPPGGPPTKPTRPAALAPIHDRNEYERQMAALPPEEREIAEQLTTFADMCQYFEHQNMDVPPDILRAAAKVQALPTSERADAMQRINQQLMEHLNDVGKDNGVRM
jgi:hypothetical protein